VLTYLLQSLSKGCISKFFVIGLNSPWAKLATEKIKRTALPSTTCGFFCSKIKQIVIISAQQIMHIVHQPRHVLFTVTFLNMQVCSLKVMHLQRISYLWLRKYSKISSFIECYRHWQYIIYKFKSFNFTQHLRHHRHTQKKKTQKVPNMLLVPIGVSIGKNYFVCDYFIKIRSNTLVFIAWRINIARSPTFKRLHKNVIVPPSPRIFYFTHIFSDIPSSKYGLFLSFLRHITRKPYLFMYCFEINVIDKNEPPTFMLVNFSKFI